MKRFENRTVLITGAGSGIGAACVRRLFAEGASIVAADVRTEEVDKVVSEFGSSERIYGVGVDASDRDQWPCSCPERFDGAETSMGWSTAPASGGLATFWIPTPRLGGRSCRSI